MTVKEHYDKHLAAFYSWLAGDFETATGVFSQWMEEKAIPAGEGRPAIDLGAGHGIQSVALAKRGYKVKAIDFSESLLRELETHSKGLDIEIINGDLREFQRHADPAPSLIICWGDTLTHLGSQREVEDLLSRASHLLAKGGHLLLSFRDYTNELKDEGRFIPVKSDKDRILTCLLEFFPLFVKVSDLLYERRDGKWQMKVSSYLKLRLDHVDVLDMLDEQNFEVICAENSQGTHKIVAKKR